MSQGYTRKNPVSTDPDEPDSDELVWSVSAIRAWVVSVLSPSLVEDAIDAATSKTTPVDADSLPLTDSADSGSLKKVTWVNLKATLKTYFDTLYNLYSHPNHSGEVTSTGDGATVIDASAITGKSTVTAASGDLVLISDASDAGNLKNVDLVDLLDGAGDMLAATYDPGTVAGDAFDMDNMTEGATTKILTDTERTKLSGIETGATTDQTAADIRGLGFFDTTNDGTTSGLDADLLDGNHATAFATAAQGTIADSATQPGDNISTLTNDSGFTDDQTGAEIKVAYEAEANTNAFEDADHTKLDGIEALADVTDAVNVGSSMTGATAKTTPVDADTVPINDSAAANVLKKVTWANVKTTLKTYFDTLYNLYSHPNHSGEVTSTGDGATVIDSTAISGKTTVTGVSGDFLLLSDTSDSGNLKKVDAGDFLGGSGDMLAATYDPNTVASDAFAMDSMVEGTTTKILTDTERTKLSGIETGADVTDATNVTAAGALMDSEVDADIKTLSLPASTTISAFGATLIDDANQAAAQTTLGVDAAGTDNSTDVTIAAGLNYITISGQEITLGSVDMATDVTGNLPDGNIASAATWNGKQDALTFGIADGNAVDIDSGATIAVNDYAKWTATGLIGQTYAEVKTDLGISGTNTGDQTSIVGITGTKAEFDTAVTDGNILYVGDSQTLATGVSDVTATATEVNLLDLAGLTAGWGLVADTATTASWQALPGGGDMAAATYDPNTVSGDAFDMDNMVEGTTTKILTDAERSKLTGIETSADVTDAINIGSSMTGATAKTTPVDADTMPLNDSADSNSLKKVTWENIKGTLQSAFNQDFIFTFDSGTSDADPGSGKWRANAAYQTTTTYFYINDTALLGGLFSNIRLNLLHPGTLLLLRSGTTLLIYRITANTEVGTGYVKIPVEDVIAVGPTTAFPAGDYAFHIYQQSGLVKLGATTASSDASITFDSLDSSLYSHYMLTGGDVLPATDGVDFHLNWRNSSSDILTGTTHYVGRDFSNLTTTSTGGVSDSATGAHPLYNNIGNQSTEGVGSLVVWLHPHGGADKWFTYNLVGKQASSSRFAVMGAGGVVDTGSTCDGIKLTFSSGNIASGTLTLYGLLK